MFLNPSSPPITFRMVIKKSLWDLMSFMGQEKPRYDEIPDLGD